MYGLGFQVWGLGFVRFKLTIKILGLLGFIYIMGSTDLSRDSENEHARVEGVGLSRGWGSFRNCAIRGFGFRV